MNDYERVAQAIHFIEARLISQPSLAEIAAEVGVSVSHFHRLFRRWAGITPKNFLQHLTAIEARQLLQKGTPVLEAALDVGLSGPGRLHDLCVNFEAASPGEISSKGQGLQITTGFANTRFGEALIAQSPRGICRLQFIDTPEDRDTELQNTRATWSGATFVHDDATAIKTAKRVFSDPASTIEAPIQLHVQGTAFQIKVWRALLNISHGELTTYGDIATQIDSPKSSRAVGTAIGKNDLAYLIPCHRVIQSTGGLGGYRWGETRKKSMVVLEQATNSHE